MRSAFVLLALLVVLAPHPARADTPQQVQKALQANANASIAALKRGDMKVYMSFQAPGMTLTNVAGQRVNLAQLRARQAQAMAHNRTGDLRCTVTNVTVQENTAQATVTAHQSYRKAATATAPAWTYTRDYVEHDTCVRQGGKWLTTSIQLVRDVMAYSRQKPTP